ncbi:MAG: ATP-binding protein, partial [Pseudanabaena sp.]
NRFVSATYSPYFEVDGSITGVVISNRDVTARREAEISLQDSEERLRLALTAANQGLYDLNPQIDNAYDAMRSKQMQLSEDDLRPSTYIPSLTVSTQLVEDKVEIRIRDNGCGLAPQIRSKILDPFFTTKPPGEGTGLGLSLTHDIIVKQHQGTLTINSELNEFTEFLLSIPIHSPNMQSFVLK